MRAALTDGGLPPLAGPGLKLQERLTRIGEGLGRVAAKGSAVGEQLKRFAKVSKSYWPGLFACYGSKDVPRTNNDLEHLFGSHRYHERRASGRKRASPGLVVMGPVRVLAGLATRLRPEEGLELPSG